MSEDNRQSVARGRRQLLMIMSIAFITLGGSYALFYYATTGEGWGTTNHGEFVTPHTTTSELGWQIPADEARHWFLWVVENDCDGQCQQMVEDLRALHILLSAEAGRVRRAYTNLRPGEVDLGEPYPKLHRIGITQPVATGVYIVDPNGNLVLFYERSTNPKFILEDLKKLLKVSQIG